MSLKFVIDKLDDVAEPLREHYVAEGGKFQLATSGEHPKVAEFRSSNVELLKKFDGIDPDAVKADRVKLAELEKAPKTDARVAELEAALDAKNAALTDVQKKADRALLRDVIGGKALTAGVQPAALGMLLDKAESVFGVVNDAVKATATFSKDRPGDPLSIDEWLSAATKEFPFLFKTSAGGGAAPRSALFGGRTDQKILLNPDARQLGKHSQDIAAGRIKVEYSE